MLHRNDLYTNPSASLRPDQPSVSILFRWRLIYLILVVSFFGSIQLSAQERTAADSNMLMQPTAIPLSEINEQAEHIRSELSMTEQRVLAHYPLPAIDTQFRRLQNQFVSRYALYKRFQRVTPNIQKLENEIKTWERFKDAFSNLQAEINSFQNRVELAREMINFSLESWQLSSAEAAEMDAPPALRFTIENTLKSIESIRDSINYGLNQSLELETRVTNQKQKVEDVLSDLQTWSNSGDLNVFKKRHHAIWNTSFHIQPDTTTSTKLQSIGSRFGESADYFRNYPTRLRTLFIFLFIFFLWVFVVRKILFDQPDFQEYDRKISDTLRYYPYALSLFLVLTTSFFVLQNLPGVLIQSLVIITLLASSYVLRPYINKGFQHVIWVVLALYLMDTIKSYVWFDSSIYRLYLYAEAFLGLAVVWYFLISTRRVIPIRRTPMNRFLIQTGLLVVVFEVIVILSNTLGYTNLSDLLLKVCAQGAIITTLVLAILFVVGDLVHLTISIYHVKHGTLNTTEHRNIDRQAAWILRSACLVIWIVFILKAFEFFRPIVSTLQLWITEPWTVGEFSTTPAQVISMTMVMFIAFLLTRLISSILNTSFLDFTRISSGSLSILSMILRYMIVVFAIAIVLGIFSIDTTKFGLIAGALGVGIGFGLQSMVANFLAGIILTFERPLVPGETIEINGLLGVVIKVGVRSTQLRSFDGSYVFVPNSTLLSNDLINWSRSDKQKRIEVRVSVGYGTNTEQVKDILMTCCKNYVYTRPFPEPMALFDSIGESSLDFRLLFWVPLDYVLRAKSEVTTLIYNALEEAHIEIPFPRRDITILNQGAEEPKKDDDPS